VSPELVDWRVSPCSRRGGWGAEMEFFPLTMADMRGDGICVAGVDADTGRWVRPVVKDYRCLFDRQASDFEWNRYHDVNLGRQQRRGSDVDPLGHHTEDYVFVSARQRSLVRDPSEKSAILERMVDPDLALSLGSGGRSLFLAKPVAFDYAVDELGKPRFRFMHPFLPAEEAPRRLAQRIRVSEAGIRCTAPQWEAFAQTHWPSAPVSEGQLDEMDPTAELYIVLSLSALYGDAYWLIVAGVHVVGRDKIWL
jgi:hypothetical protein